MRLSRPTKPFYRVYLKLWLASNLVKGNWSIQEDYLGICQGKNLLSRENFTEEFGWSILEQSPNRICGYRETDELNQKRKGYWIFWLEPVEELTGEELE